MSQCPQWEYDTSEFKDTAVTENDWVCDKAMVVADLDMQNLFNTVAWPATRQGLVRCLPDAGLVVKWEQQ